MSPVKLSQDWEPPERAGAAAAPGRGQLSGTVLDNGACPLPFHSESFILTYSFCYYVLSGFHKHILF